MTERTLRVYGKWAGNPKGRPEDVTRCITEVHEPGRGIHFYQCQRKRGFGPNGLHCKQHDPDAVSAREAAKDAVYKAEHDRSKLADQDRIVGSWIRRYKPEDYKDIVRLMTNE